MSESLRELFTQEINKAFLPYDYAVWEAEAETGILSIPHEIILGEVEVRARRSGIALAGTVFASRTLYTPSQPLDNPQQIGMHLCGAQANLVLSPKQSAVRSPQLIRHVRTNTTSDGLVHWCTSNPRAEPCNISIERDDHTERLIACVVDRGLFAGIVEDSIEPDTWPVNPYREFYESEEMWSAINNTARGGMLIVSLRLQEVEIDASQVILRAR